MSGSGRKLLRRGLIAALVAAIGGVFYWNSFYNDRILVRESTPGGRGRVTLLSRAHTLDRIYMSMQGPYSNQPSIRLLESPKRELLWVTGIKAELVGRDGSTPISREFFCHSNLTFNLSHLVKERSGDAAVFTASQDYRLFTLIPGRLEISLPEGFGIPVYSDEPLDYLSMSLNMNEPTGSRQVRFKTIVDFIPDSAVPKAAAMKPLFRRAVYGFEPIDKESPHTMCSGGDLPGMACGPFVGKAASDSFVATLGKSNTIHWMIPPGTYQSRVPVSGQLDLPYDTTVHYVTAHLHPYGKSVALVDATTGATLFEIGSADFTDRLGVDRMDEISIPDGVQLRKDHKYELVTSYHNPTDKAIDAMSILYLYCLDRKFDSARPSPVAARR